MNTNRLSVEITDVRGDGVPAADLARFYGAFGEELLNRRSKTWHQLGDDAHQGDPMALLAAYPTVMKRPVIAADGQLFLGWGKDMQNSLLG